MRLTIKKIEDGSVEIDIMNDDTMVVALESFKLLYECIKKDKEDTTS